MSDPRTRPVPDHISSHVRELLSTRTPSAAARELGVSRSVVLAAAAGQTVMPGSLALLREATRPHHRRTNLRVRVPYGWQNGEEAYLDACDELWARVPRSVRYIAGPTSGAIPTNDGRTITKGEEIRPEWLATPGGAAGWQVIRDLILEGRVLDREDFPDSPFLEAEGDR